MVKIIVFFFLILLHGCSLNNLFLNEEIDKVTVVSYTSYVKHHRAFISRSNLEILKNGKKYLYLYKKKTNDIAVLVQRRNTFFLYTLSDHRQKVHSLYVLKKRKYRYAVKYFKSMGYKTISSPSTKGFVIEVSYKRYKNIKTLLFESKDYTRLVKLYQRAISEYNSNIIKTIKTQLPKSLILNYYRRYEHRTKNPKKLEHLKLIAQKLLIKGPVLTKRSTQTSSIKLNEANKTIKEMREPKKTFSWYDFGRNKTKKEKELIIQKNPPPLPYSYYLNNASLDELRTYLSQNSTKKSLSASKYLILHQKKKNMEEEKILEKGTLEELIAAYKHNKNKKFKQRILFLMKKNLQQ